MPTHFPQGVTFRDWLAWAATEDDIMQNIGPARYEGQAMFYSKNREEARYAFADRFLKARDDTKGRL
jgi:hypothetical protein